jgi:hypothetical protein
VVNFINYSVKGLVEGLTEQIAFINDQQRNVSWENYVHSMFHDKHSPTEVRRRHIVFELSKLADGVNLQKISSLSPELARLYYDKTPKTIIRDVNALAQMGVIERRRGIVRAKKEKILAFLPWRNIE